MFIMIVTAFDKEYRIQYLATFIANIGMFLLGLVLGWVSPSLPLLSSEHTPLESGPLTIEQKQWVSSIAFFGSIIFVIFFGWSIDRLGRKISIILIGIPFIIGWGFLYFAKTVTHILIARFVLGIPIAGTFIVIPVYVSEIADSRIRGILGSAFSIICNMGIVTQFILSKYLDFYTMPLVAFIISLMFICGMLVLPETPHHLIAKNNIEEAEKSFKFYRGYQHNENMSTEHSNEFDNIKNTKPTELESKENVFNHLNKIGSLKSAFMALVTRNFPVLSGCYILITFTHEIFEKSEVNLESDQSSIISAFIKLLGSVICLPLIDKVGRKVLLISTSFGSAICLCVIGTYYYLFVTGVNVSSFSFIPIYSLCLFNLISSIGIIPVPNILVPEILDQKIRGIVMSACSLEVWIVAYLMIHFYPIVSMMIGIHGVMFFYAGACVFCGLFTLFVLPETKGRHLQEISKSLEEKHN